MDEQYEWELVKENVQPLRQGRTMSSLSKGLRSDPSDENFIKDHQSAFELELRTYDGDDPLDVWYRYVKWTEQHFPKGGQGGHLSKLIEKCLQQFQTDQLYVNDPRFIKLWIIFSSFSETPADVFAYMFDNGIGEKVSELYVEWATLTELAGNLKRADTIYTEGLNRLAEPRDLLVQKQQQFQNRMAKNITLQMGAQNNSGLETDPDEKREALSRLKASRGGHKVGTIRTGVAALGSAGKLKDKRGGVAPKQIPSQGFTIFSDENAPQQPQQTNEWVSMPTRSVDSKENDKAPGVWTGGAKFRQGRVPSDRPASSVKEAFKIHEDPDAPAAVTPMKTTTMNHKPLSAVKAHKENDVLSSIRQGQNVPNQNEGLPMYPKHKIYHGLQEYSLEELRAIQYWKSVEAAKLEAERLRLDEERNEREAALKAQLEAQAQALQAQAQRLHAQESKLATFEEIIQSKLSNLDIQRALEPGQVTDDEPPPQSTEQSLQPSQSWESDPPHDRPSDGNVSTRQLPPLQTSCTSSDSRNPVQARQERLMKNMEGAVAATEVDASKDFITPTNLSGVYHDKPSSSSSIGNKSSGSQRTPIFNSLSTYSSLGSSGGSGSLKNFSYPRNSNAMKRRESDTSFNLNQSSQSTPADLISDSGRSKPMMSAPSPTVCTKEALQLVQGMFRVEFDEEKNMDDGTTCDIKNPPSGGMLFEIFEDQTQERISLKPNISNDQKQPQISEQRLPFAIHQDSDSDDQPPAKFAIFQDENNVQSAKSTATPAQGLTSHHQSGRVVSARKDGRKFCEELSFPILDDDMTEERADYTIAHAREDMTIAPLASFNMRACAASTPSNGLLSGKGPSLQMSSTKTSVVDRQELMESEVSLPHSETASIGSMGESAQSAFRHLSPILEGSGDSSGNDTNTKSQSHASLDLGHSAKKTVPQNSVAAREVIYEEPEESPEGESMCDDKLLDATCHHIIDTSACIPEATEAILSASVNTRDPYDKEEIGRMLSEIRPLLSFHDNYIKLDDQKMDFTVTKSQMIYAGEVMISIDKCIGEGAYAKVYRAVIQSIDNFGDDSFQAVKVQSPPCHWEFYISNEMQRRLSDLPVSMDVKPSIMTIDYDLHNDKCSILVMKLMEHGSLLNLVNLYKSDADLLNQVEPFACLATIELLHLFGQLHQCNIIHGDVKPDNFLLMDLPTISNSSDPRVVFGSRLRLLCLTDFGQSIDMEMFPKGTNFKTKLVSRGFECIENRTDRPWTYQTDLFGLAGTVHVVLFGAYMKVFVESGEWKTTGSFIRKWNVPLWKKLFHELLNVPCCDVQPNIESLRKEFEDYFCSTLIQPYNNWVCQVQELI